MIAGQLIVARQVCILLLTAAGYGCWLWALAGRPELRRGQTWVWLGLAGFCVHALVLQSLVYLGLPLNATAWPALAVGVAGLAVAIILVRRAESAGRWRGRPWRDVWVYTLVFTAGFLGQAPGLLVLGPERYFGGGHYDQANYVVTAEFLRSEPFATKVDDVGFRPWLLRALEVKEQRITQCVALGALAAVDGTSAQESYGAMSAFFVALAGVATVAWLRGAGLARGAAGWAGVVVALTPGLTRIQLDGFFSQTATLFVYPALAAVLGGRGALTRARKVGAAALLAFLIGSYTEVAVVGVALVGALVLGASGPWRRRGVDLAMILAGTLLLNPGYLGRLPDFLTAQARLAGNPTTLVALFPESGTWVGWGRLFWDGSGPGMVAGAGAVVATLVAWSVFMQPTGRRVRWGVTLGVALLPLVALGLAPQFAGYAFAKLMVQFLPIWVGAAMMGVIGLAGVSRWGRIAGCVVGGLGAVAAGGSAVPLHREIVRPSGRLAVLSSEGLLRVRKEAEGNPGRSHLVAQADPLVAQWLCYFGRGGNVVFDRRTIGDRIVPTESYGFRRWMPAVGEMWWLDTKRMGRAVDYALAPGVVVHGAIEVGGSGSRRYYVAGEAIDFVLSRASESGTERGVWLDFVAVPMVQNATFELSLEGGGGKMQETTVTTPGWQRWRLSLAAGETRYRLHVAGRGVPVGGGRLLLKSLSVEVAQDRVEGDPIEIGARRNGAL